MDSGHGRVFYSVSPQKKGESDGKTGQIREVNSLFSAFCTHLIIKTFLIHFFKLNVGNSTLTSLIFVEKTRFVFLGTKISSHVLHNNTGMDSYS